MLTERQVKRELDKINTERGEVERRYVKLERQLQKEKMKKAGLNRELCDKIAALQNQCPHKNHVITYNGYYKECRTCGKIICLKSVI